jgi:hypothetical protein
MLPKAGLTRVTDGPYGELWKYDSDPPEDGGDA